MGIEGRATIAREAPTRVVIVDAEPTQREYVRLALAGSADVVIVGEAASFTAASQLLAAGPVDVALVDLLMPEIHGFQVAHRLRQLAPHVQTVVVGDEGGSHLHHLARACGAAGFIERKALSAQSVCAMAQDGPTPTDLPLAA